MLSPPAPGNTFELVTDVGYRPWPASNNDCKATTVNTGSNTTGITINNEGVPGAGKNLPPYYALAYIMKT